MSSLSSHLKAAALISASNYESLSVRTGIGLERVGRIVRGTTNPDPDEVHRLFSAVGIHPDYLTESVSIGWETFNLSTNPILWMMAMRERTAELPDPREARARLSIDKISLTFEAANEDSLFAVASGLGSPYRSKYYAENYRDPDGNILLQRLPRHRGIRPWRIEFNPNVVHAIPSDRRTLRTIGQSVDIASCRVTKVHVAADIRLPISNVQGLGTRQRKMNWFLGPRGVETVYSGGMRGGLEFRIYDKRAAEGTGSQDGPLTRFEADVRPVALAVLDLPLLRNPFSSLRLLLLRGERLPLPRRLLVEYAGVVGIGALKKELEADEFNLLVRDMEVNAECERPPHPRRIFEQHWPRVAERFLRTLGVTVQS